MRRIAYTTVGLSSFHRLAAGTAESCGHGPLSKAAPSAATALSSSMWTRLWTRGSRECPRSPVPSRGCRYRTSFKNVFDAKISTIDEVLYSPSMFARTTMVAIDWNRRTTIMRFGSIETEHVELARLHHRAAMFDSLARDRARGPPRAEPSRAW